MCTMSKIYTFVLHTGQIHTHSPKQLITHKSCHNTSLPTHYAFKSSPLPFIDSNLRIELEFWHLLILNLLTPGGPELNITPGIYLNTYKENIPKTPWIVAIHAHKRDSKRSALGPGAATRDSSEYLQRSSDKAELWIWVNNLISDVVSTEARDGRAQTVNCMWANVCVCV